MSRMTKIAVATSALIAVGAVAALSQTGGREALGGGRGLTKEVYDGRTRERFARFDRNNDGVIEAAEVQAVMAGRRPDAKGGKEERKFQRLVHRADGDRDGRVSRDEYLASAKRRFDNADLDRNGRISDADLPPRMRGRMALSDKGFAERKVKRGRGGRGSLAMVLGADTNNDGEITELEASAAAALEFDRVDRTKDGFIDRTDAQALRRETDEYRAKRLLHRFGGIDGQVTREQFIAKANERFARLDRDNDSVISRSELPGRDRGWHKGGRGRSSDDPGPSTQRPKGPANR